MSIFNIFNEYDRNRKLSYLKSYLDVALADGNLDAEEQKLLEEFTLILDMTPKDLKSVKANPDNIKFNPPSSYRAKVSLLFNLVKLMLVDNEIHEKEVEICKSTAIRINILPLIVDEIIEWLIVNRNKSFDDFFSDFDK